jgi:hypothetical protein
LKIAGSSDEALFREFWEPERTAQILECPFDEGDGYRE